MPYAGMAAALNAGRIDAAMIAEPVLTAARAVTRELGSPYAAIANEWYINMWFATKDWLVKNPASAKKFVAAIGRAATWENAHRGDTGAMLQKFLPVTDDVLAKMVRARYAERLDPALIQPVLDTAAKYDVLKAPMSATDLIY
jgi:NitT/TauT family transport system substrate-binding protein